MSGEEKKNCDKYHNFRLIEKGDIVARCDDCGVEMKKPKK